MTSGLNMKDIAYSVIKNKILTNEFISGQYLEEKMLCELVGVSRTPIREAVRQLEVEGFLQTKMSKGIFVTTIGVEETKDLFQARMLVEPIVLELAWTYLEILPLEELCQKTQSAILIEDFQELNELDYEFHNYINSHCPNSIMMNIVNQIQDQFQRVRTLNYYDHDRILGGAHEHIALVQTFRENNIEKAKDLLLQHIQNTKKYYYMSLMNQ
ncbi:GntR family transcriptional regulator [Peptoniphilaceae bacterium SGI.137]|nr:GntR family transcriptional regulator [Peptoniphilaceae bacterium]